MLFTILSDNIEAKSVAYEDPIHDPLVSFSSNSLQAGETFNIICSTLLPPNSRNVTLKVYRPHKSVSFLENIEKQQSSNLTTYDKKYNNF